MKNQSTATEKERLKLLKSPKVQSQLKMTFGSKQGQMQTPNQLNISMKHTLTNY